MIKTIEATEVFEFNYNSYYNSDKTYIINEGGTRCHAENTKIRMYDGSIKNIQDIIIGDKVMRPDGYSYNTVINTHSGIDQMYKIKHKRNGFEDYEVNGNHILALKQTRERKYTGYEYKQYKLTGIKPNLKGNDDWVFMSVLDYINLSKNKKNIYSEILQPYNDYKEQELLVDPYYMGLFLGDGISSRPYSITSIDPEIGEWLTTYAKKINHNIEYKKIVYTFKQNKNKQCELSKLMYSMNLFNNKHIPLNYLINSKENRLKLLAGIIDSDGYKCGRNTLGITMVNEKLMLQIKELILSLGFYLTYNSYIVKMKRKDGSIYTTTAYTISFNAPNFDELNKYILLKRKRINKQINRDIYTSKINIEKTEIKEYYGIELDGDHLYKLECGIVQHNSSKTYSITQLLIIIALTSKVTINVVRKQLVILKKTFIQQDLIPMLTDMGIYNDKNFVGGTKYTFDNGSIIEVHGVPNVERVKGVKSDILYINEATSLTDDEASQLIGRTTGKVFIDFNPSVLHFWVDDYDSKDKNVMISTYHNNPFVTEAQKKFYESKKLTNKTYYDVYVLGKRGISEHNVYKVWNIVESKPDYFTEYLYGFDYGTVHPTTLIKIWYNLEYNQMYLEEIFYVKDKSPSQIILEFYNNDISKDDLIICDYGGGGNGIIRDLQLEGFAAIPAEKGPKSVINGINTVRDYEILISNNSINIQRENTTYKFDEKRNSLSENPIKENDDTMDAIRYGITYIHKYGNTSEYDGVNL